jgi:hypothetical protein
MHDLHLEQTLFSGAALFCWLGQVRSPWSPWWSNRGKIERSLKLFLIDNKDRMGWPLVTNNGKHGDGYWSLSSHFLKELSSELAAATRETRLIALNNEQSRKLVTHLSFSEDDTKD